MKKPHGNTGKRNALKKGFDTNFAMHCLEMDKENWVRQANKEGYTCLPDWVRSQLNKAVDLPEPG